MEKSLDQKRTEAIRWLRERGKYILDKGTPSPSWGSMSKSEAFRLAKEAAKDGDWERFDSLKGQLVRSDVTYLESKFNRDANSVNLTEEK